MAGPRARRGSRLSARRGGRAAGSRPTARDELSDAEDWIKQTIATEVKRTEGHAIKKRRVGGKVVNLLASEDIDTASDKDTTNDDGTASEAASVASAAGKPAARANLPAHQTAYADTSDSEDEDDMDFEDVDLSAPLRDDSVPAMPERPQEITITLGGKDLKENRSRAKRKGVTAQDRKLRLEIHKMHLLCLMYHVSLRNHWCNDAAVQSTLRKVLSGKTIDYLVDDPTQSQFQRGRSFKEGMETAVVEFERSFKICARGMTRAFWAENLEEIGELDIPDDIDLPMEKADFKKSAVQLRASRDVGAQLFCAMLRGIGMDVRLVCSLQPLPITSAAKATAPEERKAAQTVGHVETRANIDGSSDAERVDSDNASSSPAPRRALASRLTSTRSRATTPSKPADLSARPPPPRKPRKPESRFPVYWIEAFEPAYQRWTPVDPLVTGTVGKPNKFEPPANDQQNAMSYVLAFEEDGSARDLTRRYTKAYNAKTRRARIESTKDGMKWWRRMMRLYRKLVPEDRDQIEDAQLNKKEAAEEMPRNIQDFKDHPYYALKRHLRKNEVIHPERACGKVFTGRITGANQQESEPVYRRRDVQVVKSADSWYRLGREVKIGEEPLKWAEPRKGKTLNLPDEEELEDSAPGAPLFAGYQTEVYVPPPAVRGRIPKNRFGNLDVYTSGMIPHGGVHVAHPGAAPAARLLNIPYADAVVGFEFRGRQGTAVVKGAVVACEYLHAVVDVVHGIAYAQETERAEKRSQLAVRMWDRFLKVLRIRERVQSYAVEGEDDEEEKDDDTSMDDKDESEAEAEAAEEEDTPPADFLPDYATFLASQDPVQITWSTAPPSPEQEQRTARQAKARADVREQHAQSHTTNPEAQSGGFMPEDAPVHTEGGFLPEADAEDGGGGFLPESDDNPAGGFLPEASANTEASSFLPEAEGDPSNRDGGFVPEAASVTSGTGTGPAPVSRSPAADAVERAQLAHALRASGPAGATSEGADGPTSARETAETAGSAEPAGDAPAEAGSVAAPARGMMGDAASAGASASGIVAEAASAGVSASEAMAAAAAVGAPASEAMDVPADDGDETVRDGEAGGDSDLGSLLSHDPEDEDEDADPEWVL